MSKLGTCALEAFVMSRTPSSPIAAANTSGAVYIVIHMRLVLCICLFTHTATTVYIYASG